MRKQDGANQETRKSKTVTDFLHGITCGAESRRRDVGTTEVIDDNTDCNVHRRDEALTDIHRTSVVSWIAHL